MKFKTKKIRRLLNQLEHLPSRRQLLLYFSAFILAFMFSILISSLVKVEKIARLLALRQQLNQERQARLNTLLSRFEAQSVFKAETGN